MRKTKILPQQKRMLPIKQDSSENESNNGGDEISESATANSSSEQAANDDEDANRDSDNDEDLGFTVSEGESDTDQPMLSHVRLHLGDEDTHLLSFLGQDSDEGERIGSISSEDADSDAFDDDDSDSSMELEEEDMIHKEMNTSSRHGHNSTGTRRPRSFSSSRPQSSNNSSNGVSYDREQDSHRDALEPIGPIEGHDGHNENDNENEDENSGTSESSDWDDTFLEDFDDPNTSMPSRIILYETDDEDNVEEDDENDESSLWEYFFTDESSSSDADNDDGDNKLRRIDNGDGSQDVDSHVFDPSHSRNGEGRHHSSQSQLYAVHERDQRDQAVVHSGDSTDEDDGVPPERKRRRARGTRPVEVLGTSSFSARPPILGSWSIKRGSRKNIGIIDGLTTRTLSPPPASAPAGRGQVDTPPQFDHVTPSDSDNFAIIENENDNENEEIFGDLCEFLNTENMEDDEDDDERDHSLATQDGNYGSQALSPYIYRSRLSRNVPLSAFRSRQSPQPLFESPLPAQKRARRRSFGREAYMSPARQVRRKLKKVKSSGLPRSRDLNPNQLTAKDLIEELVDIGAISPFFATR